MIGSLSYFVIAALIVKSQAEWHQVWEDDFNGNSLSDANWIYEAHCKPANNELECYTAHKNENARVENGHLVIDVKVENMNDKHFTSARLNSKQAWAYGKFEARAKMPKGKHLWPAIWMMPQNSVYGQWAASGEIDIMEYRGDRTNEILGTIHYGGTAPNNIHSGSGEIKFGTDFSADWHTYGIEWDANEIKWFCDGKEYHKENINRSMYSGKGKNPYTKNGQPFDKPFHWILNVAVGGNFFPANVYGSQVTPAEAKNWAKPTMEIDYVRVWEWK